MEAALQHRLVRFTKPMLLAILAALVVIVFFWVAFRSPKLVPRGMQNLGELAILAVRDQILRPSLGRKGDSYLPFLVSLFFFIYIMNVMELIPLLQFPVTSRIGFVWPLVFIVYFLYLYLGVKNQGPWGYLRNMIPPGVPAPIYIILVPVDCSGSSSSSRSPSGCGSSGTCSPATCC
jgi:F0F1-type ATP synthase, subunit a